MEKLVLNIMTAYNNSRKERGIVTIKLKDYINKGNVKLTRKKIRKHLRSILQLEKENEG